METKRLARFNGRFSLVLAALLVLWLQWLSLLPQSSQTGWGWLWCLGLLAMGLLAIFLGVWGVDYYKDRPAMGMGPAFALLLTGILLFLAFLCSLFEMVNTAGRIDLNPSGWFGVAVFLLLLAITSALISGISHLRKLRQAADDEAFVRVFDPQTPWEEDQAEVAAPSAPETPPVEPGQAAAIEAEAAILPQESRPLSPEELADRRDGDLLRTMGKTALMIGGLPFASVLLEALLYLLSPFFSILIGSISVLAIPVVFVGQLLLAFMGLNTWMRFEGDKRLGSTPSLLMMVGGLVASLPVLVFLVLILVTETDFLAYFDDGTFDGFYSLLLWSAGGGCLLTFISGILFLQRSKTY